MFFKDEPQYSVKETLSIVNQALKENNYAPVPQLVGYFMTKDPTYITVHMDARNLITKHDPDEDLEEMLRAYLESEKEREPDDALKFAHDSYISRNKSYEQVINDIVGYLCSGDPTYIASQDGARHAVYQCGREEIILRLLNDYLQ